MPTSICPHVPRPAPLCAPASSKSCMEMGAHRPTRCRGTVPDGWGRADAAPRSPAGAGAGLCRRLPWGRSTQQPLLLSTRSPLQKSLFLPSPKGRSRRQKV